MDGFVSRTKVPTLLMPANFDTYQNSCLIEMARKVAAAAKTSARQSLIEVVEYPEADHGFNLAGPKFRANDAADAFRRAEAHLRKTLGGPPPKSN